MYAGVFEVILLADKTLSWLKTESWECSTDEESGDIFLAINIHGKLKIIICVFQEVQSQIVSVRKHALPVQYLVEPDCTRI